MMFKGFIWIWSRGPFHRVDLRRYIQPEKCLAHTSSSRNKNIPKGLKGKSKSSQEWLTRQLNDPYVKRAHEMNYRARSAFKLIEIDDKAKILKPGQTVVECGAAPGAWTQVIVQRINSDGRVPKKRTGTVIGIDLLPIAPLEGAIFLGGFDFTSSDTLQMIRDILQNKDRQDFDADTAPKVNEDTNVSKRTLNETDLPDTKNAEECGRREVCLKDNSTKQNSERFLVDVILSDMAPNATGNHDTDHPRIMKLVEKALEFALANGKTGGHFLTKIWDGSDTKRLENCIAAFYDKVTRYKPPSSRNDSSELFILGKFKK